MRIIIHLFIFTARCTLVQSAVKIFTLKDRKMVILPTSPLFVKGIPLEFFDETYPAKTRGMGPSYSENLVILTSTVFTARCTLVQSAVLRSHVVCLSVRPSVCLSVCLSVCNVGEL